MKKEKELATNSHEWTRIKETKKTVNVVIPAKAGIHVKHKDLEFVSDFYVFIRTGHDLSLLHFFSVVFSLSCPILLILSNFIRFLCVPFIKY